MLYSGVHIPDHPVIRRAEQFGSPFGTRKQRQPICPECGNECEQIYRQNGTIIGCEICISREYSWEVEECFPEWDEEDFCWEDYDA